MIINPGSAHFDIADGSALVTYADYPNAATTVASLTNNPSVVTSD